MRVVLDSNVVISGLNFPGNERTVLDLARRKRFDLFLSPFILQEVGGVLVRKFGWDGERVTQALAMLRDAATVIEPPRGPDVLQDNPADNRVLDCAVASSADYLVTGDRRHLLPLGEHEGIAIVNAPQFLSRIERDA